MAEPKTTRTSIELDKDTHRRLMSKLRMNEKTLKDFVELAARKYLESRDVRKN